MLHCLFYYCLFKNLPKTNQKNKVQPAPVDGRMFVALIVGLLYMFSVVVIDGLWAH